MSTTTAQRPTWFQRNWKWFVPIGCLSLLILFVLFVAGLCFAIFGLMKQSTPYQAALTRAQDNPELIASLGTPIKPGFLVEGSVQVQGHDGEAKLSFDVSGPKGAATVYVEAKETRGEWHYDVLEADDGTPPRIDLRTQSLPQQ
jgi:hypothetical protein